MKKCGIISLILCLIAAVAIVLPSQTTVCAQTEPSLNAVAVVPHDAVDYYEQKYGSLEYFTVKIRLTASTVSKLDQSALEAAATEEDKKQYTLESYFKAIVNYAATSPSACTYSCDDAGNVTMKAFFADSYRSPLDENDSYSVKKKFYTVEYNLSYVNPLVKLLPKLLVNDKESASGLHDWQAIIACGYGKELPAISEVFPVLKTNDWSDVVLTYNRAVPKLYGSGNEAQTVTESGTKYLRWSNNSENWENVSYSYSRPYSLGWGFTIVGVSLIVAAVIILVAKRKSQKPALADYRPLAEAEISERIEARINGTENAAGGSENPGTYAENIAAQPLNKDGYAGHGVFRENGKTVDVFGNDATSAPEDKTDENNR